MFAGLEISFTPFIVLFLEPWSLFCVDWRYGCQDTGKNVNFPALKFGLQHSQFHFRTLEVIFLRLEVRLPRYGRKCLFAGLWNWVYGICHSIFRALEFISCRLEVRLPKYGRKRLFAGFENGFTVFLILILEQWNLFCVDWRYFCQATGENVYLPALNLCLLHSPLYF